ncbi:hypothetical protein [Rhizorhabdus sp.]|uniref:hypothetical protein n=1 Tax=Rhizorhabdus sp. TaxID=1968843 RepID=UPI0035B256BF
MTVKGVAIRLGTEGKAEVKRDLREIGDAGQQGFRAIGDAAEAEARRAQRAFDRASADVEAAMARQARATDKLALITPQTSLQSRISASVGSGFGDYEGSARQSAQAFRELIIEQERMEAKAAAIRAALDPLAVATDRYNRELAEMRQLQAAGLLSTEQLAQAEMRLKGAFDQAALSSARGGQSLAMRRAGYQQLGFQIGDVAAQAANGTSALVILAQQSGQVAQAMDMIGGTGKLGKLMGFIGGPWGQVIIAGGTLLALFGDKLFRAGDAANDNADATRTLKDAVDDLNRATKVGEESHSQRIARLEQETRGKLKNALATREQTAAELARLVAIANAPIGASPRGEGLNAGASLGQDIARNRMVDVRQLLAENDKAIRAAREALAGIGTDRIASAVAAEFDKAAAATRRYEEESARLRREHAQGRITDEQLRDGLRRATVARDKATGAEKAGAAARREAAKDDREYQRFLEELTGRYDPLAAAAREYREELDRIAALEKRGDLSSDKAREFRDAAEIARRRRIEAEEQADWEKRQQAIDDIRGRPGGIGDMVSAADDRIKDRVAEDLDRWAAEAEKKTAIVRASMDELRNAGGQVIDTVLDPSNWNSWGDAGRTVINMVRNELLKLALINPLKNMLFGDGLPTLAGLFGGGTSSADSFLASQLGGNAAGTNYWSGGMTWIAENGPEIVNLPRGAKVTPAGETRRLLAANDARAPTMITVNAQDAVLAETVRGWVVEAIEIASVRGASGGAELAQVQARKRAARSIR